jgi:hypothetical protein
MIVVQQVPAIRNLEGIRGACVSTSDVKLPSIAAYYLDPRMIG